MINFSGFLKRSGVGFPIILASGYGARNMAGYGCLDLPLLQPGRLGTSPWVIIAGDPGRYGIGIPLIMATGEGLARFRAREKA